MPPQTLLGRRPRGPPCINKNGCKDVNTSGGQWTYITREFAEKAGVDPDSCHCKRANCREFSGVKDPPLKPWGKRAAAMALPCRWAPPSMPPGWNLICRARPSSLQSLRSGEKGNPPTPSVLSATHCLDPCPVR